MSEELNNNNSSNIILNEAVEILNLLDTLITVELPIDSNVLPNIEPINQPIIEPTQVEQYPELPPSPLLLDGCQGGEPAARVGKTPRLAALDVYADQIARIELGRACGRRSAPPAREPTDS